MLGNKLADDDEVGLVGVRFKLSNIMIKERHDI